MEVYKLEKNKQWTKLKNIDGTRSESQQPSAAFASQRPEKVILSHWIKDSPDYEPSFFGGRTERRKRCISVLPPGVLHCCWCTGVNAAGWFLPRVVCGGHGGVSSSVVAVMALPVRRSWVSGATVVMMRGSDLLTFNPRGQVQSQPWCYCASL